MLQRGFTDNVVRNEKQQLIEAVFTTVGRLSIESFRTHRIPLLNLPEDILEALRSGQIEYTKAKAIAAVKDEELRKQLLEEAIALSLSLSQIKEKVNAAKPVKEKEKLRSRFDTTYSIARKSKQLWQDPKKRKKLESLLAQLEKLIEVESNTEADEQELTDKELAEVLGVSNLVLRDYRVKGKKPPAALAKKLLEWEVKGERWVRKL